jgi:hypothetical protein
MVWEEYNQTWPHTPDLNIKLLAAFKDSNFPSTLLNTGTRDRAMPL